MSNRRDFLRQTILPAGALCLSSVLPSPAHAQQPKEPSPLGRKLRAITRSSSWKLVDQIRVGFKTFHCQGMVKIGNDYWVSSVDIEMRKGHLFNIDSKGALLADVLVGEEAMYHPSGIDFDGQHIWIAAAEYRPDSQAIIYQFDPASRGLKEIFRWQDHIGGILRNRDTNTLHGISWGSRRFYQWPLDKSGNVLLPDAGKNAQRATALLNTSHYIDYQDNQYLGNNEILYTGLSGFKKPDGSRLVIGGFDIVDIHAHLPVHQVPLNLWSPATGAVITQNPSFFETTGDGIRAHFMPDDNDSTIFIYETAG